MAQNDDVKVLKVTLIILAVIAFVYGFGFLFLPGLLVSSSGETLLISVGYDVREV